VAKLGTALQRLVDRGDTVVVVEHNLDLVAAADCVIDLGPEGGERGGKVVAWGTPEQVARSRVSRTAPYLRAHLGRQ
jgi:excinuclease ABC subunit A